MAIFPDQGSIRLESAQSQEPTDRSIHLVVKPSGGLGDLQYFRGAITAGVGNALHSKVAGLRIALRIGAERERAIERREKLTADFGQYAAVAQVVVSMRLRVFLGVESKSIQI